MVGLDTQQDFLGLAVLMAQVMAVVGGYQRDSCLLGDLDDHGVDILLFPDTVILKFQIEIPFPKDFLILQRLLFCRFILPGQQPAGNFSR